MPRVVVLLLATLLLAAALPATPGLGAPRAAKRGWTLNSAGYLLGPHAIDNHRSFPDHSSLAGKRELQPEDLQPGRPHRPLPESNAVRSALELLELLRLRDARARGNPPDVPAALLEDKAQA